MKNIRKHIKTWLPPILWMILIFVLSSIPHLAIKSRKLNYILRKYAHIAEFSILAFLLWQAFKKSFSWSNIKICFFAGSISLLYAYSDEFHQGFIHTRINSSTDMLLDTIGIISTLIIINIIIKIKDKSKCASLNS